MCLIKTKPWRGDLCLGVSPPRESRKGHQLHPQPGDGAEKNKERMKRKQGEKKGKERKENLNLKTKKRERKRKLLDHDAKRRGR